MKNVFLVWGLILCSILTFGQTKTENTFTDPRDGKIYKIVKIGNQIWFTENLNFKSQKSWCYGEDTQNCRKYGRLYTWDAATEACPQGWHLPTDEEWKTLETELGMTKQDADKNRAWRGTDEGYRLIHDEKLGFNAKLGGYRNYPNNYCVIGAHAFYWTATEHGNSFAWFRQMYDGGKQIFRRYRDKSWGFSVRCVKD